jgi:hypothetical protein
MTWTAYRITWRLLAPMHMGWRKLGNLQQTRPYVTGRSLWGAFTATLTRELGHNGYGKVGDQVDNDLAFTYFYPSIDEDTVKVWPWPQFEHEYLSEEFAWLFLGSYVSTALENGRSSEERSLHETEFIAPYTRNGQPVYLIGYVFELDGCQLDWQNILGRIQTGGERSYGWGRMHLQCQPIKEKKCFGYDLDLTGVYPQITVPKGKELLAHTSVEDLKNVQIGTMEPLVGRITRSDATFGSSISQAQICWIPGSTINEEKTFQIQPRGIWR